jgi:hypothetical protein
VLSPRISSTATHGSGRAQSLRARPWGPGHAALARYSEAIRTRSTSGWVAAEPGRARALGAAAQPYLAG